jgi:biotin carboxyl carrier protein
MRYHATIAGRTRVVEIEPLGATQYRVRLDDGAPQIIDAERVEGQVLSLLAGNKSYDVDFEPEGDALKTTVGGEAFVIELLDDRRQRAKQMRSGSAIAGPVVVTAPMPGKVVKVLVEPGQDVAEGQGVIIIEAMKMENELRSPKAGKVKEIFASEGQTVEGRAKLVAVE